MIVHFILKSSMDLKYCTLFPLYIHKYDIDLANLHFICTSCTQFNSHFEFNRFFLISILIALILLQSTNRF